MPELSGCRGRWRDVTSRPGGRGEVGVCFCRSKGMMAFTSEKMEGELGIWCTPVIPTLGGEGRRIRFKTILRNIVSVWCLRVS